ncbi:kinase-like protein [Polyplosphaeria fusca]|uniref:non-specific serine/threonine protein kinase n=1 Tax=Polyplosphaeria fusca TaxID=682080 RepID=A0A9P4UZS5_9PLEO|nr:kinase-like protein [Polyplosphaeria fusca]
MPRRSKSAHHPQDDDQLGEASDPASPIYIKERTADYSVVRSIVNPGGMNGGINIVREETTGVEFIQKILKPRDVKFGDAWEEIAVQHQLKHPYVAQLRSAHTNSKAGKASAIVEFCPHGSLQDLIDKHRKARVPLGEKFIWKTFIQIAEVLRYMHCGPRQDDPQFEYTVARGQEWNPVWHLDLKPDNVMLADAPSKRGRRCIEIKLIDFGLSVSQEHIALNKFRSTHIGYTKSFLYPEYPIPGAAADVWQLGAIIICLCRLAACNWDECLAEESAVGEQYSDDLDIAVRACLRSKPDARVKSSNLAFNLEKQYRSLRLPPDSTPLLLKTGTIPPE